MKTTIALFIAMSSAIAAANEQNSTAAIGQLLQAWQARILAQNLPVDDAANWSRRNMAKFGRLNDERLALAQRATTLQELELVLVEAPLTDGARLDVLMSNKRGDIAMMGTHSVAKSSPATAPAAYSNLVFTALTTCRMMDTRPSQGGTGAWTAGSSNTIKIGPYATGYQTGAGAQGGSASSCGLDALAGPGQVAVIMAAVSTVSQVGAGYLTFYPNGAPNPGLTAVSQWYQPGYVQTSFVLIPTDLVGTVAATGFTSAATDVIIDVVGYFSQAVPDGVTNVATGAGLTGGPITTTGTIGLAATNLLPTVACATNQIPKWSGAAWACAADANSGGTVTGVSATAPLASSGGSAPAISLTGTVPVANGGTGQSDLTLNGVVYGQGASPVGTAVGATGQLLVGDTGNPPAWTDSPSINGNLTLVASTASAGNIMKAGQPFVHNFGGGNTFVGQLAGNFTMTGTTNSAFGSTALGSNTSGSFNTAIGQSALTGNTAGASNTAVGYGAGFNVTSGVNNTAVGRSAMLIIATGSNNTVVGANALTNASGSSNIALGASAGSATSAGNFNIEIGNTGSGADTGTIRIGDNNQTRTFVAGIRGVTTINANAVAVLIDSSGQLGTVSSSRHVKDDIADMDAASSALMKLRPVTFHYKSDQAPSGRTLQYGLIAEEVANVYPGLIAHSADGRIETVMYQFLPPMLLNEVQKQQRTIDRLAAQLEAKSAEIDELKAAVALIRRQAAAK